MLCNYDVFFVITLLFDISFDSSCIDLYGCIFWYIRERIVLHKSFAIPNHSPISIFVSPVSIFDLLVERFLKIGASVGWLARDYYPINSMNEFW